MVKVVLNLVGCQAYDFEFSSCNRSHWCHWGFRSIPMWHMWWTALRRMWSTQPRCPKRSLPSDEVVKYHIVLRAILRFPKWNWAQDSLSVLRLPAVDEEGFETLLTNNEDQWGVFYVVVKRLSKGFSIVQDQMASFWPEDLFSFWPTVKSHAMSLGW